MGAKCVCVITNPCRLWGMGTAGQGIERVSMLRGKLATRRRQQVVEMALIYNAFPEQHVEILEFNPDGFLLKD